MTRSRGDGQRTCPWSANECFLNCLYSLKYDQLVFLKYIFRVIKKMISVSIQNDDRIFIIVNNKTNEQNKINFIVSCRLCL